MICFSNKRILSALNTLLIKSRAAEALLVYRASWAPRKREEDRPRDKAASVKVALRRGKYRAASHKYRERKSQ